MAEACEAIINHIGDKVVYINVDNNLSIDCDCNGNPDPPNSPISAYSPRSTP